MSMISKIKGSVKTLTSKIVVLITAVVLTVVVANLSVALSEIRETSHRELERSQIRSIRLADSYLKSLYEIMETGVSLVGELPIMSTVVESEDEATITDASTEYLDTLNADALFIFDSFGDFLAQTETDIKLEGDKAQSLVELALGGKSAGGVDVFSDQLYTVSVAPVGDPSDPVGVIVALRHLGPVIASGISEQTGAEIFFRTESKDVVPFEKDDVSHFFLGLKDHNGEKSGSIEFALSTLETQKLLDRIVLKLGLSGLAVFVFALLVSLFVARRMLEPLKAMVESLRDIYEGVQVAGSQINSSSNVITTSTQKQAKHLELAAGTLTKATATALESLEQASSATEIAESASQLSQSGMKSMHEMSVAMGEISENNRQVSNFTNTINEIAFQTNLLALNAAVEAARAGDAGAGFAVVADEVRSLAMKAGQAATGISEIVERGSKKVEEGSMVCSEVETRFTSIADIVSQINGKVREIAVSSESQAQDMKHVSEQVGETERDAHSVEQIAENGCEASGILFARSKDLEGAISTIGLLVHGNDDRN